MCTQADLSDLKELQLVHVVAGLNLQQALEFHEDHRTRMKTLAGLFELKA